MSRSDAPGGGRGRIRIGSQTHDVEVAWEAETMRIKVDGEEFAIPPGKAEATVDVVRGVARTGDDELPVRVEEWLAGRAAQAGAAGGSARVRSPMVGRLVDVRVQEGATVGRGDVLFVLEAMKMQNEVRSPAAGTVRAVRAKAGETLDTERVVVEISTDGPDSPA